MEIKGEVDDVLVVEDFAHHPTAIRLTLEAARTRWPRRKVWAAVEPRSNTMRRKVFQNDLADSLALADAVIFGPVNRAHQLAEDDRLSPEMICQSIEARGRKAAALASADAIAAELAEKARSGDVVLVMSNGGFDGLTGKLLEKLRSRAGARA
jgi:UDP-N-acetylmuramate: L-alanyl-gamma-D-glutamyl-meso-diaminopimelate ligase